MKEFISQLMSSTKYRIIGLSVLIILALVKLSYDNFIPNYESSLKINTDLYEQGGMPPQEISLTQLDYDSIIKNSNYNFNQIILDARVKFFESNSNLLNSKYHKSSEFLSYTKNELPWHSIFDEYIDSKNQQNEYENNRIEKILPAEIFELINPMILIYPEFTYLRPDLELKWDYEKISNADSAIILPYKPIPHRLSKVSNNSFKLEYNITAYLDSLNQLTLSPVNISDFKFILSSFNASDLGLDWMRVRSSSLAISYMNKAEAFNNEPITPTRTAVFSALAGSFCRMSPDGCNRKFSFHEALLGYQILYTPSVLELELWDTKPVEYGTAPDLIFIISFI